MLSRLALLVLAALALAAQAVNGLASVPGYPAHKLCSAAAASGKWCKNNSFITACKPGLICYTWNKGKKGRCKPKSWATPGRIRNKKIVGASSGCKAAAPPPAPAATPRTPAPSPQTPAAPPPSNTGWAGFPPVSGYNPAAACKVGNAGKCIWNNKFVGACKPGLVCYRWGSRGKCFSKTWKNFHKKKGSPKQAQGGCASSPAPVPKPPPTTPPPSAPPVTRQPTPAPAPKAPPPTPPPSPSGWAGFPPVSGYNPAAACKVGSAGKCIWNNKFVGACKPGLVCYRWGSRGKCFSKTWKNFHKKKGSPKQAQGGCASSPAPNPPPASTPTPTPPPPTSSGNWHDLPNMPILMGEVSTGILTFSGTPYLVVLGEHNRNAGSDNGVTMIYNIHSRKWYRSSKRPFVGNHHASETYGNKMYLFGGLSSGTDRVQVGQLIWRNGQIHMAWSAPSTMGVVSGSGSSVRMGHLVFYCGGIDRGNSRTMGNCGVFNLNTRKWSGMPSMPKGRNHAAACTDGSSMFIFGGRSGRNTVGTGYSETQIYTPGRGWRYGAPLPLARGGMGKAVYHAGKCYVFGGEVNKGGGSGVNGLRTVYRVDVYNIASNKWTRAKDIPEGLHGIFPVKWGNSVYIAGGGVKAAYSQSKANYRYDF